MPLVVGENDAMASTPTQGWYSSEGIGFPRAKLKTIKLNRLGTVCRELRTALKIGKARHDRNPDR